MIKTPWRTCDVTVMVPNFFFRIMPEKFHTECVTLEDLRLPYSEDANFENDDEVVEHFFDFQVRKLVNGLAQNCGNSNA